MWYIRLILSLSCFYEVNSQFFAVTKRSKISQDCQNKTTVDETAVIVAATSIVECTMLCVRSDKTVLFDEVEKKCHCLERSDQYDRSSPACTISISEESEESSIMQSKVKLNLLVTLFFDFLSLLSQKTRTGFYFSVPRIYRLSKLV